MRSANFVEETTTSIAGTAGNGAIKTLKAEGGTCAWRKIFKMPSGRSAWVARADGAALSCDAVVEVASVAGVACAAPQAAISQAPRIHAKPHGLSGVQG